MRCDFVCLLEIREKRDQMGRTRIACERSVHLKIRSRLRLKKNHLKYDLLTYRENEIDVTEDSEFVVLAHLRGLTDLGAALEIAAMQFSYGRKI